MKRHSALTRLSREHHSALLLAKHSLSASADEPDAMKQFFGELTRIFACDLEPHFQLEEKLLLTALISVGQFQAVERTLAEHTELRLLAGQSLTDNPDVLRRFGEALAAHVRFEERELFPLAESMLEEDILELIREGSAEHYPLSTGANL